jgi:hypothetical protein
VKRRPHLLLAILVYVTLDLSLASMPGAFVFDAAQSIESTHSGLGRAAAEVVVRSVEAAEPSVPCAPVRDLTAAASVPTARLARALMTPRCLPRAVLDTAPASDDPH